MATDASVRRTLVVAVTAALLVLLAVAVLLHTPGGAVDDQSDGDRQLVEPVPGGGAVWPYTSRSPTVATRTLPLNVVVRGDHDVVRQQFVRQAEANWSMRRTTPEAEREPAIQIDEGTVVWLPAHGASRYTHFRTDGEGVWIPQDYQLYEGDYLGVRHHIRAYESPAGNWTAMQGHVEYWDWFRLRHTVTSTAETRAAIEAQFTGDDRVSRIGHVSLHNPGRRDGEGVATVIEFASLATVVVTGMAGRVRTRLRPSHPRRVVGLAVAVLGVYLGVRAGGLLLEGWVPGLHPKVIAGGLYPVLVLALPAVAFVGGRRVRPEAALVGAGTGLAAGLALEYVFLGLVVLPPELVLHRVAVVLAVGVLAAAGSLSANEGDDWLGPLGIGVGGWIVTLGLALFGLL